jgi:hypothetical protein
MAPRAGEPGERRAWRKLHIGVDAETGQILASELTSHDVDDGSQVGPLLEQILSPLASLTGDGAHDQADVYGTVGKRYPEAEVIVRPEAFIPRLDDQRCCIWSWAMAQH